MSKLATKAERCAGSRDQNTQGNGADCSVSSPRIKADSRPQSTMEFHISRSARDRYGVQGTLFSFTGNVVFADVAASRELAQQMNLVRETSEYPELAVNPGALFAMGLIDEATHALFTYYREHIDPQVITDALTWFQSRVGAPRFERLLIAFVEKFPGTSVYSGEETAKQWLAGSTNGYSHRHAAVEEMVLLWLANKNPAFTPFKELFDEAQLEPTKTYNVVTAQLRDYFATRPPVDDEYPNLIDLMLAPLLEAPDSLSGQLAFLQRKWGPKIADMMRRLLLAGDVLKEEELAIWMRFHPPSQNAEEAGRRWGWKSLHDSQRGEVPDFAVQQNEYERFSPDQEWMPSTVLIAKSTYVWLDQLSKRYHRHIHRLDHIPDEELSSLASRGFNALWLIGVWERSRASQTIKRLCGNADAVASAYSLYDYSIAADLGGEEAYRNLRDRSAAKGIRLASDMVPNHMGIDSSWVINHPEWFLSRQDSPYPAYRFDGPDLSNDHRVEIKIEDHYYEQSDAAVVFRRRDKWTGDTQYVYHGNDGTSFPWNDTAQLNYLSAQVREQVIQTILQVARSFPIIRFDAAMTLAKRHIQRLWFPAPGAGGAIPSRAESSMTTAEFDEAIPQEFWREVVDRVATEVPGTLLLAEAFWLMEGYFVRTLGMHRVYNSAFMVMLRDEDNANYRSVLKNTLEFDPGIMKRYVNFMSNPDERTASDQFGNGDKFFGVASMMATLPGLPMFGHGQVEGFTEKYGMEYYRPRFDEVPDQSLVERHQREIAPLLHRRKLFAESDHFLLYDYWRPDDGVDENVFAYSNRNGDQRALILFNNSYSSTRGTIHHSTNFADKASGSMRQRELRDGLGLPTNGDIFLGFRNVSNGLEYIRRASDVANHGFSIDLRGYQYAVMLDWRELRSDADHPWAELHDILHGDGVPSLEEAFVDLKMKPVHDAIYALLQPSLVEAFAAEAASSLVSTETPRTVVAKKSSQAETLTKAAATGLPPLPELTARSLHLLEVSRTVLGWNEPAFDGTLRTAVRGKAAAKLSEERLSGLLKSLLRLPVVEASSLSALPEAAKHVLPGRDSSMKTWGPLIAATVLRWMLPETSVASTGKPGRSVDTFEKLYLRKPLANAFKGLKIEGEDSWRAASRVLLLVEEAPAKTLAFETLLTHLKQSEEVRWLAGVHDAGEKTYFVKEPFEQLLWWLQIPQLVTPDASAVTAKTLAEITAQAKKGSAAALTAGYDYQKLLLDATPRVTPAPSSKPVKTSSQRSAKTKPGVSAVAGPAKVFSNALKSSAKQIAPSNGKVTGPETTLSAKTSHSKKGTAKKQSVQSPVPTGSKKPKK
jgi:glycosidase